MKQGSDRKSQNKDFYFSFPAVNQIGNGERHLCFCENEYPCIFVYSCKEQMELLSVTLEIQNFHRGLHSEYYYMYFQCI